MLHVKCRGLEPTTYQTIFASLQKRQKNIQLKQQTKLTSFLPDIGHLPLPLDRSLSARDEEFPNKNFCSKSFRANIGWRSRCSWSFRRWECPTCGFIEVLVYFWMSNLFLFIEHFCFLFTFKPQSVCLVELKSQPFLFFKHFYLVLKP